MNKDNPKNQPEVDPEHIVSAALRPAAALSLSRTISGSLESLKALGSFKDFNRKKPQPNLQLPPDLSIEEEASDEEQKDYSSGDRSPLVPVIQAARSPDPLTPPPLGLHRSTSEPAIRLAFKPGPVKAPTSPPFNKLKLFPMQRSKKLASPDPTKESDNPESPRV